MAMNLDKKLLEGIEEVMKKIPPKLKNKIEIDALRNLENPDWCREKGMECVDIFERRKHKMENQESTINYGDLDERIAVTWVYQKEYSELYDPSNRINNRRKL